MRRINGDDRGGGGWLDWMVSRITCADARWRVERNIFDGHPQARSGLEHIVSTIYDEEEHAIRRFGFAAQYSTIRLC